MRPVERPAKCVGIRYENPDILELLFEYIVHSPALLSDAQKVQAPRVHTSCFYDGLHPHTHPLVSSSTYAVCEPILFLPMLSIK